MRILQRLREGKKTSFESSRRFTKADVAFQKVEGPFAKGSRPFPEANDASAHGLAGQRPPAGVIENHRPLSPPAGRG